MDENKISQKYSDMLEVLPHLSLQQLVDLKVEIQHLISDQLYLSDD